MERKLKIRTVIKIYSQICYTNVLKWKRRKSMVCLVHLTHCQPGFLSCLPQTPFVDRLFFSFCKSFVFSRLCFVSCFCSGLFIRAERYSLSRCTNSHFSQPLFYSAFFSFSTTRGITVMWTLICFLYTASPVALDSLKLCLVSRPSSRSEYWEG